MELKFYAKEVPSTPIHLAKGRKITFDSLDGVTGYTLSADPGIIAQLDNCVRCGIGGVRPVSQAEYEEFAKKKLPTGSNKAKQWREELTPANVHSVAVAPAEAKPSFEPAKVAKPAVTAPVTEQQPFKPKTVKRVKT